MSSLTSKLIDKKFFKETENIVSTIELLLSNNQVEVAYCYELCFYARILGFIHKNFSDNPDISDLFFQHLSVDTTILNDLNRHINDAEIDEKNSESIYYSYHKANRFKCYDIRKMLNKLLKLHLRIVSSIYTQQELEKNEISKKLLLGILPKNKELS